MPRIKSEAFYKNAIKKYGITPQGVCWLDSARQQIRFDILCSLLPKELSFYSIVDVGCGFGDLYLFLQLNHNIPKHYIGLDTLEEMCHITQERTQQEVIVADVLKGNLPMSDYYICSGAMNILTKFETYLFIRRCFDSSKKGFVFNILYGEKESETYNYMTKEEIEEIALQLNVKEICYREEYLEGDISVGFYK